MKKNIVYAVGDIHGRYDLLLNIQEKIQADAACLDDGVAKTIVYLGDYIDRGFKSREVIDHLIANPLEGFESIHLMGNHEYALLWFMEDNVDAANWLRNGGAETIYSYGVRVPSQVFGQEKSAYIRQQLETLIPREHMDFYKSLLPCWRMGGYFFAHAGVNPKKSLESQSPKDLMWIREPFLQSAQSFGARVIHGHTISTEPVVKDNRIGIDTGAYISGRLTAIALDEAGWRFINVRA